MNRRVPPHSTDAERGTLGCLLVRPELLADVLDVGVMPEDFYTPKWASTFAAILHLANRGDGIDTTTVAEALSAGSFGVAPEPADLLGLMATVPSTLHAATYAERVRDYARVRRVLGACAEITEAAYDPSARGDANGFCDTAEAALLAATGRTEERHAPAELVSVLDESITELRARSSGEQPGLSTGLVDLDRMTGGLRAGQLVVLGARPSMGKSALALGIALHVARSSSPVLFTSAEMGRVELGTRVLAGGGVASDRLLGGKLDALDLSKMETRRAELATVPLLIDDAPSPTLAAIRARARRQAAKAGIALVVVDYLQLIAGEGRRERREQEVAEVSRGLKSLARELQVPVIAVAQLNRAVELRADKRPVLADLRESGQLEQDADLVLLLHRPGVYDLDADPNEAELHVAKHRNGPTGLVHLVWLASRMEFHNAAPGGADF